MAETSNLPPLAEPLVAYARRLIRTFSSIGRLSDSGVPLSRRYHADMTMRQIQDTVPAFGQTSTDQAFAAPALSPPAAEDSVLRTWCNDRRRGLVHPLLILAPFGAGKSVVLETFTYGAARRILRRFDKPDVYRGIVISTYEIPPVPFPVRLRELRFEEREHDHFLDFLVRSQVALNPNDADGLLDRSTITKLLKGGKLVPMFDGLDELPGLTSTGNIRHQALDAIRSVCGDFFAVTSRPGFDAESRFASDCQHEVQPLGTEGVVSFIRQRLEIPDLVEEHSALVAYRQAEPELGEALTRPLFLAVWCDRAATTPTKTPLTVSELMTELYLRSFDHRRTSLPLSREEQRALREPLGALLSTFAQHGFDRTLTDDHIDASMSADSKTLAANYIGTIRVAMEAGLVRPVGAAGYYAYKTTLTEYLVGRYMAVSMRTQLGGQQALIERFRRWVWQPSLQDTVWFMFETLADDEEGFALGVALLKWMADVSAQEVVRNEIGGLVGIDDLARPFALTASRCMWRYAKDTGLREAVRTSVATCLASSSVIGSKVEDLIPPNAPTEWYWSLVEPLVKIWREGEGHYLIVQELVRLATRQLRLGAFANVLDEVVELSAGADEPAREGWRRVAAMVAGNVPSMLVPDLVDIVAARCATKPANSEFQAWTSAMVAMSRNIPPERAAELSMTWAKRLDEAATQPEAAAWFGAVCGAQRHGLRENAAEQTVSLLAQARSNEEGYGPQLALLARVAAAQVAPSEAPALIELLLDDPSLKPRSREAVSAIDALRAVARCVSALDVPRVVERLVHKRAEVMPTLSLQELQQVEAALGDLLESTDDAWLDAISNAALRVAENAAERMVEEWVRRYAADSDLRRRQGWQTAAYRAASRVPRYLAADLVARWMDRQHTSGSLPERMVWRMVAICASLRTDGRGELEVCQLLSEWGAGRILPTVAARMTSVAILSQSPIPRDVGERQRGLWLTVRSRGDPGLVLDPNMKLAPSLIRRLVSGTGRASDRRSDDSDMKAGRSGYRSGGAAGSSDFMELESDDKDMLHEVIAELNTWKATDEDIEDQAWDAARAGEPADVRELSLEDQGKLWTLFAESRAILGRFGAQLPHYRLVRVLQIAEGRKRAPTKDDVKTFLRPLAGKLIKLSRFIDPERDARAPVTNAREVTDSASPLPGDKAIAEEQQRSPVETFLDTVTRGYVRALKTIASRKGGNKS
jgi:hypothetical protein